MAETVGSLVDKLSIVELKLFHMQEQVDRTDADSAHRQACTDRVAVLKLQREDLAAELTGLWKNVAAGTYRPKVYRQFKMYNDPRYRIPNSS